VVRGVLRRVAPAVGNQPLAVRQRVDATGTYDTFSTPGSGPAGLPAAQWAADDRAAGLPPAVTVPTMWGDGYSEAGVAARIAYELVTRHGPGADSRERGVLVGWLAAQATPLTRAGLATMAATSSGYVSFVEGSFPASISLSDRVAAMVWVLLSRPDDQVGARVLAAWDELADPATTVERAARLLGLPAPGPAPAPDGPGAGGPGAGGEQAPGSPQGCR
jgi:hypothetical protein